MLEIIRQSLLKLWNEWEIRTLVLISLTLQLTLIGLGRKRKRDASRRIRYTLWLAYLSADWVATVTLGIMSRQQGTGSVNSSNVLKALWAPVLLVHLGGPDTITAYSMEDNALWLRHLLGLVVQVSIACYVFVKSSPLTTLHYVMIPMFVTGIIKFGERTWALRSSSSDQFRDSLLPSPDPGPNYAKFMEEYTLKETEGYSIQCTKLKDPKVEMPGLVSEGGRDNPTDDAASTTKRAYEYFLIYKRLFADLILGFQEREMSQSFFLNSDWAHAFSIIEIELAFMFDSFYTKAAFIYTIWGRILRIITLSATFTTLAAFYLAPKEKYSRVDVKITYVLLLGSFALEIFGVVVWLFSDWALIWLHHHEKLPVKKICKALSCIQVLRSKCKWSNLIMQYNLISSCFEPEPTVPCILHPSYLYDHFIKSEPTEKVQDFLKQHIFQELIKQASHSTEDRPYWTYRGVWALNKYQSQDLNWSIEIEFDQSILLWHIATDICYDTESEDHGGASFAKISKLLSNYILYLLVKKPLMLPSGIGKIRFQDTRAEAKDFIHERSLKDSKAARERILNINTDIMPGDIKGDRSKSVLFEACLLAKHLQNRERKWEVISSVWIEILVYAASQCRSVHHAQQIAQGGELLTHVWLLLAHLGLSDHYRISEGHARVALDVR